MSHASEDVETSNADELIAETLVGKATPAGMIRELYSFVARLEGKFAGFTTDRRTTDLKLKDLTNI